MRHRSLLLLAAGLTLLTGCGAVAERAADVPDSTSPVSRAAARAVTDLRFVDARSAAVDARGTLWIADAGAGTLVRLPADSPAAPRTVGGRGSGEGAFLDPVSVDPTNGLDVFVADAEAGRVVRLSEEGRLIETIPIPRVDPSRRADPDAAAGEPVAVAVGAGGTLFVAEARRGVVLRFDASRRLVSVIGDDASGDAALGRPLDLAVGDDETLWVADAGRNAVQGFDAFGAPTRSVSGDAIGGVRGIGISGQALFVIGPNDAMTTDGNGGALRLPPWEMHRVLRANTETFADVVVWRGSLWGLTSQRLVRIGPIGVRR